MPADLHDQLSRAAASFGPAGEPDVGRAHRRGRALRRRRAFAAAVATALVLGGVVTGTLALTGTGGGGSSVRVASTPDDPSGWPAVRNDQYHVSWQVPPDWQSADTKLTTNLVDPVGVLATATFPLQPDAGACLTPAVAQQMAPTDVYVALFVWLHEDGNGGFPARPAQFGPDLGQGDLLPCVRVAQASARLFSFSDHGLQLSALVITGNQATPERRALAYTVLDSLRVGTDGGAPSTSVVPANVSRRRPSP